MNQNTINFDCPSNGSPTSNAAAESMEGHAARQRREVLDYLRTCPEGATREEIEIGLGMRGNSVRPRVIELLNRRLVYEFGTRKTSSGRNAMIVRAKQ